MTVEVLLFASAREWAGASRMELALPEGSRLGELLALPALSGLAGRPLRFAVNEEFSDISAGLADGDVVAVLPPVSGG